MTETRSPASTPDPRLAPSADDTRSTSRPAAAACPLSGARQNSDRLLLEVVRGTGTFPRRHYADLGRRMREAAAAVLLLAAAAESGRRGAERAARARSSLRRLAAQVALAERLGYLEPTGALKLLEPAAAVATALAAVEARAAGDGDDQPAGEDAQPAAGPASSTIASGGTVSPATAGQAA